MLIFISNYSENGQYCVFFSTDTNCSMDNLRLRGILLNLQDRLSDDDRKRLHFFLADDVPRRIRDDQSLGGTLSLLESLFDQEKILPTDVTLLIRAFEQIGCFDAARCLRAHMNNTNEPTRSLSELMPSLIDRLMQDDEDHVTIRTKLVDEMNNKNDCIDHIPTIPVNNIQRKLLAHSEQSYHSCAKTQVSKLPWNIILLILLIIAIVECVWIVCLHVKLGQMMNHRNANNSNSHRWGNTEDIPQLSTSAIPQKRFDDDKERSKFTEGSTCGCQQWCKERNSSFGVCADGHACVCRNEFIPYDSIGHACTCDQWCRTYAHKCGGICGDGYTCICS
ncbi:unnamed protein product [Adineta ricciae]|uniref:DED domain-containing protein n=1 Tax=Adineta ricciae TaxID=249248 RepID=A0A814NKA3_ADIRI|nr:unnamed protein product [Adineta ricciae]